MNELKMNIKTISAGFIVLFDLPMNIKNCQLVLLSRSYILLELRFYFVIFFFTKVQHIL